MIANLPDRETLELLEPIVIFLAYSYYQLCDEDISKFDPQICGQHLQECLKKALKCYDDLEADERQKKRPKHWSSPKRALIESIYMIFNLGSEEAMQRAVVIRKDPDLQCESTFLASWTASKQCWQGNWCRAIRLTRHLPVLLQGLVHAKHMPRWRERLLMEFSAAYNSPNVSVPCDFLQRTLSVDATALKSLALHFNIEPATTKDKTDHFGFSRKTHRYDAGPVKAHKEIRFTFASI